MKAGKCLQERKSTSLTSGRTSRKVKRLNKEITQDNTNEEERYTLTPWGCLYATFLAYNIDLSSISGTMGEHIVEDFMELMAKCGYVKRKESDED